MLIDVDVTILTLSLDVTIPCPGLAMDAFLDVDAATLTAVCVVSDPQGVFDLLDPLVEVNDVLLTL